MRNRLRRTFFPPLSLSCSRRLVVAYFRWNAIDWFPIGRRLVSYLCANHITFGSCAFIARLDGGIFFLCATHSSIIAGDDGIFAAMRRRICLANCTAKLSLYQLKNPSPRCARRPSSDIQTSLQSGGKWERQKRGARARERAFFLFHTSPRCLPSRRNPN